MNGFNSAYCGVGLQEVMCLFNLSAPPSNLKHKGDTMCAQFKGDATGGQRVTRPFNPFHGGIGEPPNPFQRSDSDDADGGSDIPVFHTTLERVAERVCPALRQTAYEVFHKALSLTQRWYLSCWVMFFTKHMQS